MLASLLITNKSNLTASLNTTNLINPSNPINQTNYPTNIIRTMDDETGPSMIIDTNVTIGNYDRTTPEDESLFTLIITNNSPCLRLYMMFSTFNSTVYCTFNYTLLLNDKMFCLKVTYNNSDLIPSLYYTTGIGKIHKIVTIFLGKLWLLTQWTNF